MQVKNSTLPAMKSYVQIDTSNARPSSKIPRVLAALCQWWGYSRMRLVVWQLRQLPSRIQSILKSPDLRFGWTLPTCSSDRNLVRLGVPSSYQQNCMTGIQRLMTEHSWIGELEAQMAAQAFQYGAEWALSNSGNGKGNVIHP